MPQANHRLKAGDPIVLLDSKGRSFWAELKEGGRTDIKGHVFSHDEIIGEEEGFRIRSSRGALWSVIRAPLYEQVPRMPRYATVIYPKDLGTILVWADVYPGARILEAGLGSGALATALLRVIGPEGTLFSYEVKEDAINRARKNIRMFLGEDPGNHHVKQADVYAGIDETDLDRIVLDVPEPWQVVPHAARALRSGGILCCYSPTVLQVKETVEALERSRAFVHVQTYETLMRPWHVTRRSVRPELQMIGHTGFLTFAHRVRDLPGFRGPEDISRDREGAHPTEET